jgi:parallel beta-helix repeat protein
VKDSYIAQSGTSSCVTAAHGEGNVFKHNSVRRCGYVFKHNTVRRCGGYGVVLENSKNSISADNKFYATSRSSIVVARGDFVSHSTGNRITGNQVNKFGADGIVLECARNVVADSNVIVDVAEDGIVLKSTSGHCTIKNNTVRKCGTAGLRIRGADDTNVIGNTITFCRTGVLAGVAAKRNRLINNRASSSTVFDLSDMSANCGSKMWKGNIGKGNIACTRKT